MTGIGAPANIVAHIGADIAWLDRFKTLHGDNPRGMDPAWRGFFESLGEETGVEQPRGPSWAPDGLAPDKALDELFPGGPDQARAKLTTMARGSARALAIDSVRAGMLIRGYRMRGHLLARLDPLSLDPPAAQPELEPSYYGFSDADMDKEVYLNGALGLERARVGDVLEIVRRVYCGTLAVEYMHITDPARKAWIQERIEGKDKRLEDVFTPQGKRAILWRIIEAEEFEKFLAAKHPGAKRFGLDGAETMAPALEQIIKRGSTLGARDIVMGMPHRGRLNVLAHVMNKPLEAIFHEFGGGMPLPDGIEGSGDVKYHLGASSDRVFDGVEVHLSLAANPSHLEAVNPVVLGRARARQDRMGDTSREQVLPLLIHGDAAFAGQGVVAECFSMSHLKGHRSGGAVHFIVNNQIGFTTAPRFARSSPYPTDVAKMVDAPIFHANGDDPEAVVYAARLAIEFRQRFHSSALVDMFCYRRFGHNETDEPAFTQPRMYARIRQHPRVSAIYQRRLAQQGVATEDEAQAQREAARARLQRAMDDAPTFRPNKADWLDGAWRGFRVAPEGDRRGTTGASLDTLRAIARKCAELPEGFQAHRLARRLMETRRTRVEAGEGIDWAGAEALAFGSLLLEGFAVRLSGQDCERGTFSQRHATLVDQETEAIYTPLANLAPDQARFEVVNSMLSEEAVLGYEYGYSIADPSSLAIWEAQFGDFANGAQAIIDQFITCGESKWLRMSGLVMMLPHGYEGQGPEHSSARVERYLQSCAEDNIQVVVPTTPANLFHALRRQVLRDYRKPLVLFTPKSLLRARACVSSLAEFGPNSSIHRIFWDDADPRLAPEKPLVAPEKIRKVLICSGKVYYEMAQARAERGIDDVYLLRVEQLYPFPEKNVERELARFPQAEILWLQEEPRNMGAWDFVRERIDAAIARARGGARGGERGGATRLGYVGRPASAATATGSLTRHQKETRALIDAALGDTQ